MSLLDLRSKSKKERRRVGRGNGSGKGTFCGRGVKGQKARAGGNIRPGFEGGQTPLARKMPKIRGFKNINHKEYQTVNVGKLNIFENNAKITTDDLFSKGLIAKKSLPVKLLNDGKLEKTLEISVHKASAQAIKTVEAQKGKVILPK